MKYLDFIVINDKVELLSFIDNNEKKTLAIYLEKENFTCNIQT